ncbi:MAG TPA: ABC transporter permease [Thermofilum sp.]|nr:ABC transporter permease [Thermofilum sp.]
MRIFNYYIKIERRSVTTPRLNALIPFVSVLISLLIAAAVFAFQGIDPLTAYKAIFIKSFGTIKGITHIISKLIPLLLCGVGLIISFRSNLSNIGAEGQIIIGALAATWIALYALPSVSPSIVIPCMFFLGFLAGGAWAAIPAILRIKFNVNEVISTLMMNYVAFKITEYLIYGPWKGESTWGFPQTDLFPESVWLPMIPGTYIHYPTLVLALSAAVLSEVLISRTKLGYELRVFGLSPDAAKYAGISFLKVSVIAMFLSGGLAGLAGVGEIAGIHHRLRYPWAISSGYGYTAIIVAWLSRLNCLAAIPASFMLAGLLVGGDAIQVTLRLPVNVVYIFNGLILLCVAGGEILTKYRVRILRKVS